MPQPIYEFGGSGPVIHLAVANGFPPGSYKGLLLPLTVRYRVVSLPPRALWPESDTLEKPDSWQALADDLLTGLRVYDLTDVIAVGHSFGGVASMLAAIEEPERFRGLCLLDPTVLPPPVLAMVEQARRQGVLDQMPLAVGARRRRSRFADEEEAFFYWRAKPLFRDWSDRALRDYVESTLRLAEDGSGLELAWSPEWEAHYYETIDTRIWEIVPRLRGLLPTLVIAGETTDTFTAEAASKMHELLPEATYATVPGHGHLFPLSAPDATRALIEAWLAALN